MASPHLHCFLPHITKVCSKEPGRDTPDLDPILLQLVVPVQHQHVKSRLAAAVTNRLELDLLGPAGRLRRRGEISLACLYLVGETGHEDQAGVGGLEHEGHECPGHDMRASNVHVVGLGEAVAERGSAGDEFEVESGPLRRGVTSPGSFMKYKEVRAYQRY